MAKKNQEITGSDIAIIGIIILVALLVVAVQWVINFVVPWMQAHPIMSGVLAVVIVGFVGLVVAGITHKTPEENCALGIKFSDGDGVPKDEAKAAVYFRKAAEEGHARGQFNLAICLERGLGVVKNESEAVNWLKKSANLGFKEAQFELAVCLEEGCGTAKNDLEAMSWFRSAGNQDHLESQIRLAVKLMDGIGASKDERAAIQWLLKAKSQGSEAAVFLLCFIEARNGDADAQLSVGYKYMKGVGTKKDMAEAAIWFQESADQGNAEAQHALGLCYQTGNGVPKDHAQAATWVRHSAEQGNTEAQKTMGKYYESGTGVTRDWQEAIKWLRTAAILGDPDAQYDLASRYIEGEGGVSKNHHEGRKWLFIAIESNHAGARRLKSELGWRHGRKWFITEADLQEAARQLKPWVKPRTLGPSVPSAYAVLGISPSASEEEVKKAFRTLIKQHHPDKHHAASPEVRKKAEELCCAISDAYEYIKAQPDAARREAERQAAPAEDEAAMGRERQKREQEERSAAETARAREEAARRESEMRQEKTATAESSSGVTSAPISAVDPHKNKLLKRFLVLLLWGVGGFIFLIVALVIFVIATH